MEDTISADQLANEPIAEPVNPYAEKLDKLFMTPDQIKFDPTVMRRTTFWSFIPMFRTVLDEMVRVFQLQYVQALLEAEAERDMYVDNISDMSVYSEAVALRAYEIAEKSLADGDYFVKNKIDADLHKPVGIIRNIMAKSEEMNHKIKLAEYKAKLVENLRVYSTK